MKLQIKANEIKPLDVVVMTTFMEGETRTPVHFTARNFRDSTKVSVFGPDGEHLILDANLTVTVIRD